MSHEDGLLVELVVQHYIAPDVGVCVHHLVENVLYLFHTVILSCLVNNCSGWASLTAGRTFFTYKLTYILIV